MALRGAGSVGFSRLPVCHRLQPVGLDALFRAEPALAGLLERRDRRIAKFWIGPVALAGSRGFREHELNQIARLVADHQKTLLEAWHDYFGT